MDDSCKLKMDQGVNGKNSKSVSEDEELSSFQRLMAKLREDAQYRTKVFHSMWIALALFALGTVESQFGPTFLDLQLITGTGVEQASAFFTVDACGFVLGATVSGVISKKANKSLVLFLSMISIGAVTIITPHCSIYGLMVFVRFINGIFAGLIDTTGNSEHMRIWGNDGRVLLHFIHFCIGVGSVISPLITEPFLAERQSIDLENVTRLCSDNRTKESKCIDSGNPLLSGATQGWNFSDIDRNRTITNITTSGANVVPRTTNVHYAFLITGIIACVASLPFLVLFIHTKSSKAKGKSEDNTQISSRKLPKRLYLFLIFCLCTFYMFYMSIEDTFIAFLMTFVVREYPFVSKSEGAYITAVYWGCSAASRFAMIFVPKLISPAKHLLLSGIIMIISFICFTISATYAAIVPLTVFAGMAGLSTAGVFPAGMSWSESELLRFTGRVSSSIFVAASLGSIINPLVVAFLMEEISNMWFCYLFLLELGAVCIIFIFLLLFNRYFVNKRYGPLYAEKTTTMEIPGVSEAIEPFMENGKELENMSKHLTSKAEGCVL